MLGNATDVLSFKLPRSGKKLGIKSDDYVNDDINYCTSMLLIDIVTVNIRL